LRIATGGRLDSPPPANRALSIAEGNNDSCEHTPPQPRRGSRTALFPPRPFGPGTLTTELLMVYSGTPGAACRVCFTHL